MFERLQEVPDKSFLLLGPRGTGKSTWLKRRLKDALFIDLLRSDDYLKYSASPGLLRETTRKLGSGDWVVIDEIQRVPELLNEVHAIYEDRRLRFALSGSSARKLRRSGANLLAGRAVQRHFFPLVYPEYGKSVGIRTAIEWGTLPLVCDDLAHKQDILATYVETYLRQEIAEEGAVRRLEPFTRFLQVVGILNGQVLNVENVAAEARVKRPTVDKYLEVLTDTLIGHRLPAYRPGLKVKEAGHPKFYLFDAGVARACAGLVNDEIDPERLGFALETLLLNEIRAHNHYSGKNRELAYYRVTGGEEIDFVIETRKKSMSRPAEVVLVEVKHSRRLDSRWIEPLAAHGRGKLDVRGAYVVYLGAEEKEIHGVKAVPLERFLERLHRGQVF